MKILYYIVRDIYYIVRELARVLFIFLIGAIAFYVAHLIIPIIVKGIAWIILNGG